MKSWDNLEADVNMILTRHYTPGRGGAKVNKVVVHYNAGNLTTEGCYSVWQSREASAHYQVEDDGRIGQLVWDSDTAWHAGDWNANVTSVGIEHANRPDGTITAECLDNGAHLVAACCRYFGLGRPQWLKNVFPHKYFKPTSCPGQIYGSQKDEYIARAQQWYDYMAGSGSEPSGAPSAQPEPAPSGQSLGKVHVRYALRNLNGGWNAEVCDFNNSDSDGFAGVPNGKHDLLYVKVDKGSVRYRAHIVGGGWLDWVTEGDPNDTVNGCAGIPGRAIDGVQVYYATPDGYEYQQAWYRSQTTARAGWLGVCCDDGNSIGGYDGWAGMYGEPMDRLQIAVGDSNPF